MNLIAAEVNMKIWILFESLIEWFIFILQIIILSITHCKLFWIGLSKVTYGLILKFLVNYLVRIFTKPEDEIAAQFEDAVNTEHLLFNYGIFSNKSLYF